MGVLAYSVNLLSTNAVGNLHFFVKKADSGGEGVAKANAGLEYGEGVLCSDFLGVE